MLALALTSCATLNEALALGSFNFPKRTIDKAIPGFYDCREKRQSINALKMVPGMWRWRMARVM